MTNLDGVRAGVDRALEASVVGSFTRIGPAVRRRLFKWEPPGHRMDGKVAVVTGATSGLGLVTATELARLGSRVVLLVRDVERGRAAGSRIAAATGSSELTVVGADVGDLDAIRHAAAVLRDLPAVDVLIHNAGALSRNSTGISARNRADRRSATHRAFSAHPPPRSTAEDPALACDLRDLGRHVHRAAPRRVARDGPRRL